MAIADSLCINQTTTHNGTYMHDTTPDNVSQSARRLASQLDAQFKLSQPTKKDKQHQSTSQEPSSIPEGSPQQTTSTPAVDRVWIPLSQSTPVGSAGTQPKDILKARSKLSTLVESVHTEEETSESNEHITQHEVISPHEDDDDDESPDFDETPSKVKPSNRRADISTEVSTEYTKESEELQELKRFREFISKMPNGHFIVAKFESGSASTLNEFSIEMSGELEKTREVATRLQEENERLKAHSKSQNNSTMKEKLDHLQMEVQVLTTKKEELTTENKFLKTQVSKLSDETEEMSVVHRELKSKFEDFRMNRQEELTKYQDQVDQLNQRIQEIRGSPEGAITIAKFPDLAEEYARLDLSEIDTLSQIQAQNIIKNILVNLNFPYKDIRERITGVVNQLQNGKIFQAFANQVHRLLYDQPIQLDYLKRDELHSCIQQMLLNIEQLHQGSRR